MLDNIKLSSKDQSIINQLAEMPGFVYYKPQDKYYKNENKYYRDFFHSFKHEVFGVKFSLHFQKVIVEKVLVGYSSLHIVISPHYHFNNYLHNGNDFTPQQCIKTLIEILQYISIKPHDFDALKVVNIEFGLNIIPEIDIQNLINNILYYKKTPFKIPEPKNQFSKRSDNTKNKYLKAYAKGLQFADSPQFRINLNTFRFEVKSKKSFNIKKYGIDDVTDLLKIEIYQRLGQELLNEWDNVLLTNVTPDFSTLKPDEVRFIKQANKPNFWKGLISEHRNKFGNEKRKYYKILTGKNNLHTQIKGQFIDKLISLSKGAYLPSETLVNIKKQCFRKEPPILIKGQFAPPQQLNRLCLVTGLSISMQKKTSKYLCSAGLKYYKENEPETYQRLKEKYLTTEKWNLDLTEQIYFIAHNIRNTKTNPNHNPRYSRKRFEIRNYPPDQLQFNFNTT